MLLNLCQKLIHKPIVSIWCYIRFVFVVIHSLYLTLSYLLIVWVLLSPIYYIRRQLYMRCENTLYNWALYTAGYWSYGPGIIIHELGDDYHRLTRVEGIRVVFVANHQSTADVPLLMQSMLCTSGWRLLWVMDSVFKWTNFGVVSATHGDYFLDVKNYKWNHLLLHITAPVNVFKNAIIIFPEGGFRYKLLQSSNKFAVKHNHPVLSNVTYPRFVAYSEIMDPLAGITHVVDVTIAYEDIQKPLTIVNVLKGDIKSKVIINYRIYEVNKTPEIRTQEWLQSLWRQKEVFLHQYYTERNRLLASVSPFNVVTIKWFKVFLIQCFFSTFWIIFYILFKTI